MKDGGPAYPVEEYDLRQGPHYGSPYDQGPVGVRSKTKHEGMSLRDYFAAAALTGLLIDQRPPNTVDVWAELAYALADAMLAARKGPEVDK